MIGTGDAISGKRVPFESSRQSNSRNYSEELTAMEGVILSEQCGLDSRACAVGEGGLRTGDPGGRIGGGVSLPTEEHRARMRLCFSKQGDELA